MSSLPLPPPPPHADPALDPGASSSVGGKKKRGGAPKAKGAVRAKSGCYTCRIRRKKCDEQPDRDGNCQTCVRLRLECLGFGAKRPDWMRENNSVQELREKIKQFLASQGMIKGHSGGGVRPADQDPSVLNLSTEGGLPHNGVSPNMQPANGDRMRQPQHMPPMSSVRDGTMHEHLVHFAPMSGGPPFPPPPGQGVQMFFSMAPPASRSSPTGPPPLGPPPPQHSMVGTLPFQLDPDLANMPHMPHAYGHAPAPQPPPPTSQQQASSHPMSSIPASPWPSAPSLQHSSFGASYNINDDYLDNQVQEGGRGSSEIVPAVPTSEVTMYTYPRHDDTREALYVSHYMEHVLKIQYLLADSTSIKRFIYQFAQTSLSARSAMCLLSAVHQQRMRQLGYSREPAVDSVELDRLLRQTKKLLRGKQITEGDAMAGLHVVSCFLFMGGQGPWEHFLELAMYWVSPIFEDKHYSSPLEAYRHCSESAQFIIRTTMWFDVWSAITRKTRPRFSEIYRQLFDNEHGYPGSHNGDVDMLSVMGCTNETVLAMSETASLASWKEMHYKQGNLSMPMLIERGRQIETRYLSREHDATLTAESASDDLDTRRRLAANVFRSSARVYLHSVLSGCLPHVEEIAFGVGETVNILKRVPTSSGASRSVVRSVVLSIALCGCMTDDESHRTFLSSCLVSLAGQEVEVLGNCKKAKELMARVWERRDGGEMGVDWRDVIGEMSTMLLLV